MVRRSSLLKTVCAAAVMLSVIYSLKLSLMRSEEWLDGLMKTPPDRKRILIRAYYRGGSTLLGSMLQSHPDVFFFYEPLHALSYLYYKGIRTKLHHLNGTQMKITDRDAMHQEITSKVLDCRFTEMYVEFFNSSMIGKTSKEYEQCIGKSASLQIINECLPILTNQCKSRAVTAAKAIRYPMRLAERFFQKDQSVKMLHLVRDPRGSLASQLKSGFSYMFKASELKEVSDSWCSQMYEDVLETRNLQKHYPGSVKFIYYEDLTLHTQSLVREVYQFLELPLVEEVEQQIREVKSTEKGLLHRSDALQQINKWRTYLQFEHVKMIDESCGKLYDLLGYLPAVTEHLLKDLKHPLVKESLGFLP